jgi:hypothetical protein
MEYGGTGDQFFWMAGPIKQAEIRMAVQFNVTRHEKNRQLIIKALQVPPVTL